MTFEQRFNEINTRQNRLYVRASLAHIELDKESEKALITMILQDRAINQELRGRRLAFVQPFIEAGYVSEEDFAELEPSEVRALLWQVRARLASTDPLRKARLPRNP